MLVPFGHFLTGTGFNLHMTIKTAGPVVVHRWDDGIAWYAEAWRLELHANNKVS